MSGFPITRQGLQEIAQLLFAGVLVFGLIALVVRSRGGEWRRFATSAGVVGGLVLLCYALAFTVAPNIPTPPVPFTARFARNPTPDTDETIAAGRATFQANCAICHGPRALGDGPAAFTLNPKPVNLQLHAPQHAEGEVFYWIGEGVAGTGMPAWKVTLTPTQRWEVVRYIYALASKRIER